MQARLTIEGNLLTPDGFVQGQLRAHDGRIVAVDGKPVSEAQARADATRPLVLPGFVDLHLHGGGGADTMAVSYTHLDVYKRQRCISCLRSAQRAAQAP